MRLFASPSSSNRFEFSELVISPDKEVVTLSSVENKIETIKVDQKSNSRYQVGLLPKDEIKRN